MQQCLHGKLVLYDCTNNLDTEETDVVTTARKKYIIKTHFLKSELHKMQDIVA